MWLSCANARGNLPFPITEGNFLIGRSSECQIVVFEPTVSRIHARLTCLKNQVWIEDLGSRNGTLVQGRNITRSLLRDAAEFCLGKASLCFSKQRFLAERNQAISSGVTQVNVLPRATPPDPLRSLTSKQHEIFLLLVQGLPPKEVALRLDRSPDTVHSHVKVIYETFEVHSQTELLAKLLETG
jgi:pSer/pThr/pTyr-binding forkhead associated (FHA) protein